MLVMGFIGPAKADSFSSVYSGVQTFSDLLLPEGSRLTLGAGPTFSPDYLGSDDYEVGADFVVQLRLGKLVTFDNDGIAINILRLRNIQFGPVFKITGGRNEKANPALAGLGNIGSSLDLGLYAKALFNDKHAARIRYRQSTAGGTGGGLVDLQLSTLVYRGDDVSVAIGARGTWAGKKYARKFFGVTPEQSAASGLPEYQLGSVARDVRFNAGTRWQFSEDWALSGYFEYTRLLGNVADSPIVAGFGSPDHFAVGAYVSYTFQFKKKRKQKQDVTEFIWRDSSPSG